MKIIRTILESHYFSGKPPVLIDIGASGEINKKWTAIAPYSICLAFDADDRDFQINEVDGSDFKKLISVNRIVTATDDTAPEFYLTASPYCSSLLKPDQQKLRPWVFHNLFTVNKVTRLPAVTLTESLAQASINYIDWFKTDTQGTDLRLFTSLSTHLSKTILAAEFEPGIIDAYVGEDKLYMVMKEMGKNGFWLSSMDVKGTQRLNTDYVSSLGAIYSSSIIRKSPCWAEVTYLRDVFPANERDLLLLFVFSLLEKQYGFALEVIDFAIAKSNDRFLKQCKKAVLQKLANEKIKTPLILMKRKFNKLFQKIND